MTDKHKYKDLVIKGSKAPDGEVRNDIKVTFSREILHEYIPLWEKIEAQKGIKLLALIMAQKEGFYRGKTRKEDSRAYRYNNPGNIGNTDNRANKGFDTLTDGIEYQIDFLTNVAKGTNSSYPLGKLKRLKPFYSKEIADNQKTYQLEPYCPGYVFEPYTGRLDEFIKIYSTGARQKNTYLSLIISYFKNMGYEITESTTLGEILKLK